MNVMEATMNVMEATMNVMEATMNVMGRRMLLAGLAALMTATAARAFEESGGFTGLGPSLPEVFAKANANVRETKKKSARRHIEQARSKVEKIRGVNSTGITPGKDGAEGLAVYLDGSRSAAEVRKEIAKKVPELRGISVVLRRMGRITPE